MKAVAIILLISTVFLSGCIDGITGNDYIGTYQYEKDSIVHTRTIQNDNTYLETTLYRKLINDNTQTEKGAYKVYDDNIQLTGAFGYTDVMKHSGVNLTDQKGNLWIKQ